LRKTQQEYDENRERKIQLHVRLDEAEMAIVNEKFKASNHKTRSEFIRQLILYGMVFKVDYNELQEMNYQLEKIGNNINQIAHRMNSQKNVYRSDVEEVKKRLDEIWQLQKSILSSQP